MKYKVTCDNCRKSDEINIIQDRIIDWVQSTCENIVSGRKRFDNQWGWECLCGNNDLLTKQESRQITNKQTPDPQEVADIVRNLKPDKSLFTMQS